MGKGDKRSKRGKIIAGTSGVTRQKKKTPAYVISETDKPKKATAKKPAVKKTTTKKTTTKKTTVKKAG